MAEDTIRHTVVHETFHDLNTRKDFKQLVDEAYNKAVMDDKAKVEKRTAQYKKQFPDMNEQAIKEEVAADYYGNIIGQESAYTDTFSYKYQTLWQRAKLLVTNLASFLRGKDTYAHSETKKAGELFDRLIKNEKVEQISFVIENNEIKYSLEDFSNQVDKVYLGQLEKNITHILVRKTTPKILLDLGLLNKPMLITPTHTKTALGINVKNKNTHNIDKRILKQLPSLIEKPIIIMDSIKQDSIVMFINATDNEKTPILCSVNFKGKGFYNSVEIDSNVITSVYGKDTNPTGFISSAVDEDRLLYWNKEMSQDIFNIAGLQLPNNIFNLDSNIIIHKSRNISNTFEKKSLKEVENTDFEPKYSLTDSNGRELTKEQAEFFKDSKVRDEQGRLLEVYHGTNAEFNVFKQQTADNKYGKGFYFSQIKGYASLYGDKIIPVYLDIKKPIIFGQGNIKNLGKYGYDGIIQYQNGKIAEAVVINPNQIKLTTNLNPTDSEDIRYSLKSTTISKQEYAILRKEVVRKNAANKGEIKPIGTAFTANNFYVYDNYGDDSFRIKRKLKIVENEDVIKFIERSVENENITDARELSKHLDLFKNKYRFNESNRNNDTRTGTNVGNGGLYRSQSQSDGIGTADESSGIERRSTGNQDRGIKYSLEDYSKPAIEATNKLLDSEIVANETRAHFYKAEAIAKLIDSEIKKNDGTTNKERLNRVADTIMDNLFLPKGIFKL